MSKIGLASLGLFLLACGTDAKELGTSEADIDATFDGASMKLTQAHYGINRYPSGSRVVTDPVFFILESKPTACGKSQLDGTVMLEPRGSSDPRAHIGSLYGPNAKPVFSLQGSIALRDADLGSNFEEGKDIVGSVDADVVGSVEEKRGRVQGAFIAKYCPESDRIYNASGPTTAR